MTIDLDALEKNLRGHQSNDCIVDKKGLLELIQRLREAEKSKARYEFCVQHDYLILEALEVYTYDQAIADREIDAAIDQQRKMATGEDLNL